MASKGMGRVGVLAALLLVLLGAVRVVGAEGGRRVLLPVVQRPLPEAPPLNCQIPGAQYEGILVEGQPTDRPAAQHADLNLALRGYQPVSAAAALVDYNGAHDPAAPQLYGLFEDERTPIFVAAQRVHQWDWECNCRVEDRFEPSHGAWPVSLLEMATTRGEPLHVPDRLGGAISHDGHKALVLYADESRITLKYTREDNVIHGYTVHIEHVCVDPVLLSLYRSSNQAGRGSLPALHGQQALGVAQGDYIGVSIRDVGTWMDPRSRKDWWVGR